VTAKGHFDQFPAISPSVGYLFGQETFAGASGNDEDAPKARETWLLAGSAATGEPKFLH